MNQSQVMKNHKRQNSLQKQTTNINNSQSHNNTKKFQLQNTLNENSYQANQQSTAINEQDCVDLDEDTAANSATQQNLLQQQPAEKLKTHLKDLAQLESDINRLMNDQQLSKNNFEKMKMFFRKHQTKQTKIKNRGGAENELGDDFELNEESSEIIQNFEGAKKSQRRKMRNNSFDYYKDNMSGHSSDRDNNKSNRNSNSFRQNLNEVHKSKKKIQNPHNLQLQPDSAQNKKADLNELNQLQLRLRRECKGDLGIVDPMKAFSFLNVIQKEDCPEAYEPEIVLQHKQRMEEKRRLDEFQNEIDKTLFDFDDEIDKLSNVSERYQVQGFHLIESKTLDDKAKPSQQILNQDLGIQDKQNKTRVSSRLDNKNSKQHKKRQSVASFAMDEVKAELIKDLSRKNKQKERFEESKNYGRDDRMIQGKNQEQLLQASFQKINEKLISSIKQRRNIFNHQPQGTIDPWYRSNKNRVNLIPNISVGQQSAHAFNRYKNTQNSIPIETQARQNTSAKPDLRSKREGDGKIDQNITNIQENSEVIKIQNNLDVSEIFQIRREKQQQQPVPYRNPQSLERPAEKYIKDIYGKINKESSIYKDNTLNINKTMLIYENYQSRPLTSNNRKGSSQRQNLFAPSNQKNLIYNPNLQNFNLNNQIRQGQNQSPFQNLNTAFSEVALCNNLNHLNTTGQNTFLQSQVYPQFQNQNNTSCIIANQFNPLQNISSLNTSSLFQSQFNAINPNSFIPSKNGTTFYPGIIAKHKHIDRLEKYFCSNAPKPSNTLKQNNQNSQILQSSSHEKQKRQMQKLKQQQSNLIGTSLNFGEISGTNIGGATLQCNNMANNIGTMIQQSGLGSGNVSSKRRLNQSGKKLQRSQSFSEGSIYGKLQYTPMRNRKNMVQNQKTDQNQKKKLSRNQSFSGPKNTGLGGQGQIFNKSQSLKGTSRNQNQKPLSTFGCSYRKFDWTMYGTEQQKALSLKPLKPPEESLGSSKNMPIKATNKQVSFEQNQNNATGAEKNLRLDYGIQVNPKDGRDAQQNGKQNGDEPTKYYEPHFNRLNTKDTKKLYGQGDFNPFTGETYDERYKHRYMPMARYQNMIAAGKSYKQNEKQSLGKNNSTYMSQVLNHRIQQNLPLTQSSSQNQRKLTFKSEISEKPNRFIPYETMPVYQNGAQPPQQNNLQIISSLRTDPSMVNVN